LTYRNKKLLDYARHCSCQHCGINDGTVVASHSNQLRDGKGKSLKAPDYRVAYLCFACHHDIDAGNHLSRAERLDIWEQAHRKTVALIFEQGVVE
jgi:hypothetical protein